MRRDDKTKCECGGDTEYYNGALGYEAMQCKRCGFHWSGQTEAQHERQLFEYRLIKQAVTRDLIAALDNLHFEAKGYLRDLSRHSVDATTLIGALKQAKATLDQAKVESN
jgi:hypothetical protein